jgi:hypothetical protein
LERVMEQTPQSAHRPGVWSTVFAVFLTLWVGFFAVIFGFVAPAFHEILTSFGADVHPLTWFVILDHWGLTWSLLLFGFLVQLGALVFLLATKTYAARRFVWIASGCNIAANLVVIYAPYIPLPKLDAVV